MFFIAHEMGVLLFISRGINIPNLSCAHCNTQVAEWTICGPYHPVIDRFHKRVVARDRHVGGSPSREDTKWHLLDQRCQTFWPVGCFRLLEWSPVAEVGPLGGAN